MRGRKMVLVGLMALLLAAFLAAPGFAAMAWHTCTVNSAGPTVSGSVVTMYAKLTAETGPAFMVKLKPLVQKEMLAVLLTAISSNLKVAAYCDPAASGGTMPNLYLLSQ